MPFPLIARTRHHQVFLWGAPSLLGWKSAAADIAKAMAAVENGTEWNELPDSDVERLETLRKEGSREQFVAEWEKQVRMLKPYPVPVAPGGIGDASSLRPPITNRGRPAN